MTAFRVWAPRARAIALRVRGRDHELGEAGEGWYETDIPDAEPGDDYWFVVDDVPLPDPRSRWQPHGIRGPSRVPPPPSPRAPARPRGLAGRPARPGQAVIYEIHVGAFSREGTFDGAIPHLGELAQLGVTAIELMPVAEFPGERGWGYDGIYISAPQSSYGGPAGLRRLVDAAHGNGLAVILDVVYNHVGASGVEALEAFGPYFTEEYETPWGRAIDYQRRPVREWVCDSATHWIREFGIDGLRLDAIHSIFDPTDEHVVAEIARRVHSADPGALVIGEIGLDDPRAHGAPACDAIWDDHFHHALHTLLTGERDGYYASFGRVADLADALRREEPGRTVAYAQNHDQVGNRAYGDRLPRELQPLAALCTLLSPFIPLLFMGEEYGEPAPFQFFSDHVDEKIARATREGRRREFAAFRQFGEEIPDPQDRETFERSKLTRERDGSIAELYGTLLRVRRELPPGPVQAVDFDEQARWLRVRRGEYEVLCNFGTSAVDLPPGRDVLVATEPLGDALPPLSGALVR